MTDHLDLEAQAKVAVGLVPGVRVAPGEMLPNTEAQVREFCWGH